MSAVEADLLEYGDYDFFREDRIRRPHEVAGSVALMMVLDWEAEMPAAICHINTYTHYEQLDGRDYALIGLTDADTGATVIKEACFKDGLWLPARSERIDVDGTPAITGYLLRVC